jgi:hypothetical protein
MTAVGVLAIVQRALTLTATADLLGGFESFAFGHESTSM